MRQPLNPKQQQQVTTLQQAIAAQQNTLNAYVQGIIDGVPDVPEGMTWQLEGTALVGTLPESAAPPDA